MKKGLAFLILTILLFGFVAASLNGQMDSIEKKLQENVDKVETTKNTLADEESRDAYLKKELISIFEERPFFKQIISGYRKVSPYTNPTLEYLIGMRPELSLFFVLILAVWFFLVKYFFTVYDVLRDFSAFSDLTSLAISMCFFIILTVLQFFQGISLFLANKVVVVTEFLNSPMMKIVAFFVFVFAMVFLSKFSKQIRVLVDIY